MTNCKNCGKKLGFLERDVCKECTKKYGSYYEQWKSKQLSSPEIKESKAKNDIHRCEECGFFEEVLHEAGGVDSFGIYSDHSDKTYRCRKFSMDINDSNQLMADKCFSYIAKSDYQEKCLSGKLNTEKPIVQIVLDFSCLKDVMAKGGLVMTAYNCPNCNGMVSIPETGKVLVCQYCGTPIKPVDIFEKINTLMQ